MLNLKYHGTYRKDILFIFLKNFKSMQNVLNRVIIDVNDSLIECQEVKTSKTFKDLALFTIEKLGRKDPSITCVFFLDIEHTKRIPLE